MKDFIKEPTNYDWSCFSKHTGLGELHKIKNFEYTPTTKDTSHKYVLHFYNKNLDMDERHTYLLVNNQGVIDVAHNEEDLNNYKDSFHLILQNNPYYKKLSLTLVKTLCSACGHQYCEYTHDCSQGLKSQYTEKLTQLNSNNEKIWKQAISTKKDQDEYFELVNEFYGNKRKQEQISSYIRYLDEIIDISKKSIISEK